MILLDNTTKPWLETYNDPRCVAVREKIEQSFSDIIFDEGPHTYTLNGRLIPSVSKMVELFVQPFDSKGKSQACFEKYFNDPTSKYCGMTAEEIEKSWRKNANNATTRGTIAHEFGESCKYYFTGEYDKILPDYKCRLTDDGKFIAKDGFEAAIAKFWIDMPDSYVPICAENKVYGKCGTETVLYAGTFDLLIYSLIPDKEGLIMFDYKTNADLFKNFKGQKMLKGLSHMLDTPKGHYEVQQSSYEASLNEIGLSVIGKRLIWIKESGEYELVKLTEQIKPIIMEEIRRNYLVF